MLHRLLFCWFLLLPLCSRSQTNLVRNASFEFDTIAPPIEGMNWHRYENWMSDRASDAADPSLVLTQHWFQPTKGTPDYFNSERSNQVGFAAKQARTGNGRMGIIAGICHHSLASWLIYPNGYSEYIETRLVRPLEAGKTYCVRYWVALDRKSNFAAARLGALLTPDSLLLPEFERQLWGDRPQPQVVHDSTRYITADKGWVMVCDTFIAKGGEQFLTIGNFDFYRPKQVHKVNKKLHGDLRWSPIDKFAYYYIDDVSVTEVVDDAPLCMLERDSVPRNNLLLIIDIGNHPKNEQLLSKVQLAIHSLALHLNPTDLLSLAVIDGSRTVILEQCPADSVGRLSAALDQVRFSNYPKKELTIQRSYALLEQHLLPKGNNRVIVLTTRSPFVQKSDKVLIADAAYYRKIAFSVIYLGTGEPDKKTAKLALSTSGKAITSSADELDLVLKQEAPRAQKDTPYSGRRNYVIASWIFLSKLLLPLLVVIIVTSR